MRGQPGAELLHLIKERRTRRLLAPRGNYNNWPKDKPSPVQSPLTSREPSTTVPANRSENFPRGEITLNHISPPELTGVLAAVNCLMGTVKARRSVGPRHHSRCLLPAAAPECKTASAKTHTKKKKFSDLSHRTIYPTY